MSDFEPEALAVRPPSATQMPVNGSASVPVAKRSSPPPPMQRSQPEEIAAVESEKEKNELPSSAADPTPTPDGVVMDKVGEDAAADSDCSNKDLLDDDDLSGGNLEADEQMLGTSEEEEDEEIDDDEEDLSAVSDMLKAFPPAAAAATHDNNGNGNKTDAGAPAAGASSTAVSGAAATATATGAATGAEMKPVKDTKLELALNHEEPTVRNLILAAIGVMKNRKARPDTKRICNWIHRRYGQPYGSVSDELERLCASGELTKVEYKGSVSFRIINPLGKTTKRRRRGTKPLGRTPAAKQQQAAASPMAAATVGAAAGAALGLPPMVANNSNDGSTSPVISLRTLVCDMHGDASGSGGLNVSLKAISEAVETTQRNVSRATVLGNLDLILEKEVQVGHFVKTGPGCYYVPPLPQGTTSGHGNGVALPQGQQPVQQDFPGLHSPPQQQVNPASVIPKTEPLDSPQLLSRSFSIPGTAPDSPSVQQQDKSEEERKNDLIQEKLFKMSSSKDNTKGKSPGKKLQQQQQHPPKAPLYLTLREKRLGEMTRRKQLQQQQQNQQQQHLDGGEDSDAWDLSKTKMSNKKVKKRLIKEAKMKNLPLQQQQDLSLSGGKGGPGRKRKREAWSVDGGGGNDSKRDDLLDGDLSGAASPQAMRGSLRKKKSRKIFDPADHEAPTRKRKISSSPTPPMLLAADQQQQDMLKPLQLEGGVPNGNNAMPALSPGPGSGLVQPKREVDPTVEVCMYCGQGSQKKSTLIRCKDCPTIVHPVCMEYSEELTRKILTAPWQCINCKTCSLCQDGQDGDMMLFCDSCDLGYHMRCHRPQLTHKPAGRWECFQCNPNQPGAATPSTSTRAVARSQSNDYYSENSYSVTSSRRSSANTSGDKQTNGHNNNSSSNVPPDVRNFLPLLPRPTVNPATGELPDNWEDYPVDPSVPDCAGWSAVEVMNHFLKLGFQSGHVAVFLNEEIDGNSLLLLHRQDVLTNLGLKLGPALKVFKQVRRLQTRRNLPN